MDYSMENLDEMCRRIDALTTQLDRGGFANREDDFVIEIVGTIQSIGAGIAWAYGTSLNLGERYAQPFVDNRMCHRFKYLLNEQQLKRDSHSRVAHQILQTIHIMLSHTPPDSTLFCNLSAGFYLNEIVSCRHDFRSNDDLLHMWLTVIKEIAMMVRKDNYMLFYNPMSENPFPIFSEAIRFYHHHVAQVRTIVQAITLEIFAKLTTEEFWQEPQFRQMLAEYFTHVCCLLREFWRMVDGQMRSTHPTRAKDFKEALRIQNDILLYLNDVFVCDIPIVSETLQEKLLHFAVLPVLVRSMLRLGPENPHAIGEEFCLSPSVASFLLYDALTTLKSAPISVAVASALLRREVPEQALHVISGAAPQTPKQYVILQSGWGSVAGAQKQAHSVIPDDVLYQIPKVPIVSLLKAKSASPTLRNSLIESFETVLRGIVNSATTNGEAISSSAGPCATLCVTARLLRTLRSTQETLGEGIAERVGSALCHALAAYGQLKWPALESSLCALRELATLADSPLGLSRKILSPLLETRVLRPLATELLRESKQIAEIAQVGERAFALEKWIDTFHEQWTAHHIGTKDLPVSAPERELLDLGSMGGPEQPGALDSRARCLRVLLCAHDFYLNLTASASEHPRELPGVDEVEAEELSKFQPNVPVHIGKVNRVKCSLIRQGRNGGQEVLYMIQAQSVIVLVRPDEQKPFWAVPVLVEPLRSVRLLTEGATTTGGSANTPPSAAGGRTHWRSMHGPLDQMTTDPTANNDESLRVMRLEVCAPRSPILKQQLEEQRAVQAPFVPPTRHGTAAVDNLSMTVPPLLGGAMVPVEDRIAHSVPANLMSGDGRSTAMTLLFSDERRKRVGCKVFAQSKHRVCQRIVGSLDAFLQEIRDGR